MLNLLLISDHTVGLRVKLTPTVSYDIRWAMTPIGLPLWYDMYLGTIANEI